MALTARIRFGASASNAVPVVNRGETVEIWCDFLDEDGALDPDTDGVACIVYWPGGAERDPAITPVEVVAGTWRADVPATLYSGLWRIVFASTAPSAATATAWFRVVATEPDEGPAPDPSWTGIRDDAEAARDAAQAAQIAAVAAQAAAESAASANAGPMLVTSVGGTATAYTGVAARAPLAGSEYLFTPTVDSGAPPVTLQLTVESVAQTARQLREDDGTHIVEGQLRAGRTYRLSYDSSNLFRVLGEEVAPRVVRPTSYSWIYAIPGDSAGFGRVRFRAFSDGDFLFDSGTGSAFTSRFGYFDNAFRFYDPRAYLGPAALGENARILTDHRPPLTYRTVKRLIGAPPGANGRTSPQRLVIPGSSPGYYQLSGLDQHRYIIVPQAASGTWIDAQHLAPGADTRIICLGSAVAHLYCGEGTWVGDGIDPATLTAHSWLNTGGKLLTVSAGGWVDVIRENTSFLAVPLRGTVSAASGVTMPAPDVVMGFGWQSWGVDGQKNGAPGWLEAATALGLGTKYYSVPTAAVGASALLYSEGNSTLFYWDQRTDTPSRRLLDLVAAIKADRIAREALMGLTATADGSNAPAMGDLVIVAGLNEMEEFGPASTHPDNNPAVFTASMVKLAQYVDGELGYQLRYWLVPTTSQDDGTFGTADDAGTVGVDERAVWHAVRMAQLRCPAAGVAAEPAVDINIAPEISGDPRSGGEPGKAPDRHYDYGVTALQVARLACAYANKVHGQSNHLGPFIPDADAVVSADSGVGIEWDVVMDYGTGRANEMQATRPESAGFRLLPAATGDADADDFATPLEIVATRWVGGDGTTLKLRCTLAAAYTDGTPRPSVLWGPAAATDELACNVYTYSTVTNTQFWLRQYLSGG